MQQGTGKTVVLPEATLTVRNTVAHYLRRRLENQGTGSWTGGDLFFGNGILVNQGTFAANSNGGLWAAGESGTPNNLFDNQGTFLKQGTGTAQFIVYYTGVGFSNSGIVDVQGGTLRLTSSFGNQGTVIVGIAGVLDAAGGFSNAAAATLETRIAGTATSQYGRVVASGTATLAGTYTVTLAGGFLPVAGNTFNVLTFGSRSGDFGTVNGLVLPNGLIFNRTLSATAMTLTASTPLLATETAANPVDEHLSEADLSAAYEAAVGIWMAIGLPQHLVDRLHSVELVIADVADLGLATTAGFTITVDRNAAGHGWFVDPTWGLDEEFASLGSSLEISANTGSAAYGRMDLLSVLLHEQGHILGLDHSLSDLARALMSPTLGTGTRRKLSASLVDELLANEDWWRE